MMKTKICDLDRWDPPLHAPYERVFVHRPNRIRYCGVTINRFAAVLQDMAFNPKRLMVLNAAPLTV